MSQTVWAFDSGPFDEALALSKKKDAKAAEILEKAYDFKSPDVPLKVAHLDSLIRLRLSQPEKAEDALDKAIRGHLSWWPPAEATAPEVGEKIKKESRGIPQLMYLAADTKAARFVKHYDDLSPSAREKIKADVKLYYDALSQTEYEPEKVQALMSRVQEHEESAAKEQYKLGGNLELSYWTWEDRMFFSLNGSAIGGHAVVFTPCVGGSVDYRNAFYQFLGGGCVGMGKGGVKFDDGTFDNSAKVTLLEAYGGVMRTISDGGSAVGLEAHAIDRVLTAKNLTGQSGRAEDQGLAFLAVGRFHFWKIDLKLKGGAMISNPSGIWALELAIPVY